TLLYDNFKAGDQVLWDFNEDKYDAFSRGFENTEEMIPEIKIVFGESSVGIEPRAAAVKAGASLGIAGNTISLVTAKAGDVSVDVYGMNGRRIATLFHGALAQGSYAFSLENMPKGMYIVRVKGAGITATQPALVK
ncbi:MAG: T9SS type A sorting domain-containing protein, partial [Fibrobacter sp.]|nr:T9SS type A sorting domain-containing protein [Fibrobacter sp.]